MYFITLIYVYYRNQKDLVLILYCSYYFEHVVDSSDHVMMDTTPLDDLGCTSGDRTDCKIQPL